MLNIKPTHKPIKQYYAELKAYEQLGEQNEGTVRTAFQNLLQHYSRPSRPYTPLRKDAIHPRKKKDNT